MKKAIALLTLFGMVIFTQKEALAFDDNRLNLFVYISKDYMQIWARGGSLPEMFYKECKEGNTINLCVLRKESEEEPGEIETSRSVYDELAKVLSLIHNRFIDSPDVDEIIIAVDDDIATSIVLRVQHEAKAAGFSKIIVSESKLKVFPRSKPRLEDRTKIRGSLKKAL
jgi:hypothetical protein